MAHSSSSIPLHPVAKDTAPQAEKRKMNLEHIHADHVELTDGITAKRVKVDDAPVATTQQPTLSKASGLWVQQSHAVIGKPKPSMLRKSASVNDLWVKQTIAFVTRDV